MRYLTGCFGSILVVISILTTCVSVKAENSPDKAISHYHKGLVAETIGERETHLEKALELYLERYNLMKQSGEINGLLCYNIANCYFNLEQNEEAIFYYQIGKKLLPTNPKIAANLEISLEKRNHAVDMESSGLLESILFFHYKFSLSQRINFLVSFSIFAALGLVWMILRPNITARYLSIFCSLMVVSLFASLGVDYYMPKHMGILMNSSDVRRGAGNAFVPIVPHPLGSGSSIQVLSLENGWYSVKLNDGRQGFIQGENLKIVVI